MVTLHPPHWTWHVTGRTMSYAATGRAPRKRQAMRQAITALEEFYAKCQALSPIAQDASGRFITAPPAK